MSQADLRVAYAIQKVNDGWFMETPDKSHLGPYLPDVVLQAAVTHALLARRRGVDAHIFMRDKYGGRRSCVEGTKLCRL